MTGPLQRRAIADGVWFSRIHDPKFYHNSISVTYAGGVGSMEDIQTLKMAAGGKLDVTVGSALDLFGGTIPFEKLIGNL